ncbi:hypothetical protein K0M31_015243, partial [Melipona bicolor]
ASPAQLITSLIIKARAAALAMPAALAPLSLPIRSLFPWRSFSLLTFPRCAPPQPAPDQLSSRDSNSASGRFIFSGTVFPSLGSKPHRT